MSGLVLFILRIAIAAALYAFLAWGFYTLWQDLKRAQSPFLDRRFPELILDAMLEQQEISFQASTATLTLGRDPGCNWVIENPTLSSRHARLSYHHGQWWVEDLRSTNGSFLNDEPVTQALALTHNDVLRCGSVEIHITINN